MIADREAVAKLQGILSRPTCCTTEESWDHDGARFDPWDLFDGALYGSYSSDFDDMAILTLDNIVNRRWGSDHGEGLAHEMFREMLCCANLCDYGTSPRGCFPTPESRDWMPVLLARWREYRIKQWSE